MINKGGINMHNEKINELFIKKLNELEEEEIKSAIEKLKGCNVLKCEIKLVNEKLYSLIENCIGTKNIVITVNINGEDDIKANYYYKGKKIKAITDNEEVAGAKISMYDLLTLAKYQDSNIVKLPSIIYHCRFHKCKSCDKDDLDELNSIMACEHSCLDCDYYEENEIGLE